MVARVGLEATGRVVRDRHGRNVNDGARHTASRSRKDAFLVGTQSALAMALLLALAATDSPLPAATWRTCLVALLAVGAAAIGVSALVSLRPSFRIAPTPRSDAVLIQHGVYRRLRHPMYTSVSMLVTAITLHHPSVGVIAVAAVNLAFYLAKARYEESLLQRRYPDYARYRARTWGVVPGL